MKYINITANSIKPGYMRIVHKAPGYGKANTGATWPIQKIHRKRLLLNTENSIHIIPFDDILFLQAESNYTRIHLTDRSSILASKTLKVIAFDLPCLSTKLSNGFGMFLRLHQSYLININALKKIEKGKNWNAYLENDHILPIARARRKDIMEALSDDQ